MISWPGCGQEDYLACGLPFFEALVGSGGIGKRERAVAYPGWARDRSRWAAAFLVVRASLPALPAVSSPWVEALDED
jgi:hypothetical protein